MMAAHGVTARGGAAKSDASRKHGPRAAAAAARDARARRRARHRAGESRARVAALGGLCLPFRRRLPRHGVAHSRCALRSAPKALLTL